MIQILPQRYIVTIVGHMSFPAPNDSAKFHQIRFKIATAGVMTDTHRQKTDRQSDASDLFVPCYAIAVGHIMNTEICTVKLSVADVTMRHFSEYTQGR